MTLGLGQLAALLGPVRRAGCPRSRPDSTSAAAGTSSSSTPGRRSNPDGFPGAGPPAMARSSSPGIGFGGAGFREAPRAGLETGWTPPRGRHPDRRGRSRVPPDRAFPARLGRTGPGPDSPRHPAPSSSGRGPKPRRHHHPPQDRATASMKIHQRRLGRIPSSRFHRDRKTEGGSGGRVPGISRRHGREDEQGTTLCRPARMGGPVRTDGAGDYPAGCRGTQSEFDSPGPAGRPSKRKEMGRFHPTLNHRVLYHKLDRRDRDLPEFTDTL